MDKRDRTAAIVDGTLNFLITGSAIAGGLLIPNLLVALDKPLNVFWKELDKREKERETRRVVTYMKSRGLIRGDYEHGLKITRKGIKRLASLDFKKLTIKKPNTWDRKWRLVFFDIPEDRRHRRIALIKKLRGLDFYQLQKSVWIHPFPCRNVIEKICVEYGVQKYISYVEIGYIDSQEKLLKRFKKIIR